MTQWTNVLWKSPGWGGSIGLMVFDGMQPPVMPPVARSSSLSLSVRISVLLIVVLHRFCVGAGNLPHGISPCRDPRHSLFEFLALLIARLGPPRERSGTGTLAESQRDAVIFAPGSHWTV